MKMKKALFAVWMSCSFFAGADEISQSKAIEQATAWMAGNPIMSKASQSVASVETFPDTGTYSVYVVQLDPTGYLILNSDDRLPLLVSFSADSQVDLSDDPQNALRAMLLSYCASMEEELSAPATATLAAVVTGAEPTSELYGPFLETSWNQNDPYNLLCPEDPTGSEYYGYRVSSGCVPTAYAQLLNFHRWPLHGTGSRSYTDSSGSMTGSHSAVFSDAYDWGNMKASHSPSDSTAEQAAVSELIFELGVAAEIDYEASGSSSDQLKLGSRLGSYFFFESIENHSSQTNLIAPLEADLRAGFPCIVSYPGHSFVADGLMVDNGVTTYHLNYGWGGSNNGWCTADATYGGALDDGITSLRPQLLAFPKTNSVNVAEGESVELNWILPKQRESELSKLTIKQLEQQAGNWSSDASEITGMNSGWEISSSGDSGDCWYAEQSETRHGAACLLLNEIFVPDASAQLTFQQIAQLYRCTFSIEVSTDDGTSYEEIYSAYPASTNRLYESSWSEQSVSLAAYAGQQLRMRFRVDSDGGFYDGDLPGIRLDELAVTSGDWYDWQPFATYTVLNSRRFSDVTSVLDDCDDFSIFEVTTTDLSYSGNWSVTNISDVGDCFYKSVPEYSDGVYHLTSLSPIMPTDSTRLLLHVKYDLYQDPFSVLVSTDRISFTEVWSTTGSLDWGDVTVDLSAYAGQSLYVRLQYNGGGYYTGGGVWIDSISTQEVTNPELEGQPVYYTTLSDLTEGTHTLAATVTDTNSVEHALAPSFTLSVSAMTDDGDGMPSDWENLYGLDTSINDADLDPDEDGYSNWQEYVVGTNPTNASRFAISAPYGSGSALSMGWDALSGRNYTVESRNSLTAGSWQVLTNFSGTNGIMSFSATNLTPACFYRINVQLE
jgi:hypothetical protein